MLNETAIRVGGRSVLYTTSVISSKNETIEIAPFSEDFELYTLRIEFIHDEAMEELLFRHYPDEHVRIVELKGNVVETFSNVDPMYVANWNGQKIFLDIASRGVGALETFKRQTTITLYEGGAVDE